ncbi:MAG: thiamine pyrophosphate-binding protein [Deltaproteobacteria bacterium]|nr:thiamine pyrophosphate-binding protein [Deltaproteobacteria bacterium]
MHPRDHRAARTVQPAAVGAPDQLAPRRTHQRAARLLVEQLKASGIDTIFGLPGGAVGPLYDALLDEPSLRVITTRHEAGAMFAAAGYAWATERPAAVIVTSGPGALNCMTGIASARCDSLPVIVIAGEVARTSFGKGALQEGSPYHLGITAMARCAAKLAVDVPSAESLPWLLRQAVTTATTGRRGPVFLSVPLDVSMAEVPRQGALVAPPSAPALGYGEVLDRLARTLERAKRPAILAGSGVRWGRGPERLRALAERLQVPVMTTPKAKGVFPESHPLSLGVFGYGGHPSAQAYASTARIDVLLALGSGLSDPATNGWSPLLAATEHLVHVDIDAGQIGRSYPVSLGVVGRAEDVLEELLARLPPGDRELRTFGVTHHSFAPATGQGLVSPVVALEAVQWSMPADTLYTCDIGQHLHFATHTLRLDHPRSFLSMTGLASMGSAIPAAVGAAVGDTRRPVVAICGDGGYLMSLAELATAAQARLPVTVVVLDDRRYSMVELGHLAHFGRTPGFPSDEVDIAALARGAGAEAVEVAAASLDFVGEVLARPASGPRVLHVRIDPAVRMPSDQRSKDMISKLGTTREQGAAT